MAVGANISEDYSISDARTGVVRVSRLRLTGWGDAPTASAGLLSFSDQGRLWFKYTLATTLLEVFRRSTMLAGDLVANDAAVADGKATLVEQSSSGLTGTLDIDNGTPGTNPAVDATLDAVVSYCDEKELATVLDGLDGYLKSGKWNGEDVRFEALLKRAKRKVDKWIVENHDPRMRVDTWGRVTTAHLVNQMDFARCQALVAASFATEQRSGFVEGNQDTADRLLTKAADEFADINPVWDYERDLSPDNRTVPGLTTVRRA